MESVERLFGITRQAWFQAGIMTIGKARKPAMDRILGAAVRQAASNPNPNL